MEPFILVNSTCWRMVPIATKKLFTLQLNGLVGEAVLAGIENRH